MVLLKDKKYACETCIKGHRSSACKHTDRPLYEIKKKGRPVTQCEHCRELRKTKQVHVKCLCGQDPNGVGGEASNKKGTAKLPAVAAFPNGLPEDLEALAVLPATSDGSVDSDHSGETSPIGCRCKKGGPCDCAVPRKSVARRRMSNHDVTKGDKHHSEIQPPLSKEPYPPLSSHVIARIAELRPVLPRPSRNNSFPEGPIHDPSLGIPHGYTSRHHSHENMYYSPYGRAYEHAHTIDFTHDRRSTTSSTGVPTRLDLTQNSISGILPAIESWQSTNGTSPSSCACGDSCRCPGCTQHNNATVPPGGAYASCANPATCSFCLDCTIFSISANTIVDPTCEPPSRDFDEWMSAPPLGSQSTISPYDLALSSLSGNGTVRSVQMLVPRSCACAASACACPPEGCQCDQPDGPRSRTTFAVSGERGLCCDKPEVSAGANIPHRPPRIADYIATTNVRNSPLTSPNMRQTEYYPEQAGYMSVSDVPSRSSSASSTSSRLSRTSPISGNNPGIFHLGAYNGNNPQPGPPNVSPNNYPAYAQSHASPRNVNQGCYDTYSGFNPTHFS